MLMCTVHMGIVLAPPLSSSSSSSSSSFSIFFFTCIVHTQLFLLKKCVLCLQIHNFFAQKMCCFFVYLIGHNCKFIPILLFRLLIFLLNQTNKISISLLLYLPNQTQIEEIQFFFIISLFFII